MLLFILAIFWVLVCENEVDLVGSSALIGTKHDDVWGSV
jgi:hypothetical protein